MEQADGAMAAGGGLLLRLWTDWGVQAMVLASFALQVFLLVFGAIRRRSSSTALRIALWLSYMSADSTAIYTLGHLSVATRSRQHQLVAFWAPFLLLHLGGPDNITAYALEDNTLWLRHLQTLAVQVLGAAYVLYKYMYVAGSRTLLLLASVSMFAVGLAKYGERIWALNRGNTSGFSGIDDTRAAGIKFHESIRRQRAGDEEEILLGAHSHFDLCKGVFSGITVEYDSWSDSAFYRADPSSVRAFLQRNLYKLVEMELSLMYDILYTKAAVIHTWYGLCIRIISLLGTAAAFLLFQLSISSSSSNSSSYRRADVVVSYVLLAGALVLEATSLCRALLSTWACSFLDRRGTGWRWLLHVVTSLRRRVQPASRRLYAASIGQYDLLQLCTSSDRNGTAWRSRLANKLGLQEWWDKLHFSGTFLGTDSLSVEDLKMLVLGAMRDIGTGMDSRGRATLRKSTTASDKSSWSVDIDLDKSILVWHIATHVYIRWKFERLGAQLDTRLVEATKVLSNYNMFLLVVKPDMLPGRTRRQVYHNACKKLDSCWRECWLTLPRTDNLADWLVNFEYSLRKTTEREEPADIEISSGPKGRIDYRKVPEHEEDVQGSTNYHKVPEHEEDVYNAVLLTRNFMYLHNGGATLKMIFQVWVEIMLYVAEHCSRDSHARQLSNGGEFITIVWLMAHHLKCYSLPKDAVPML